MARQCCMVKKSNGKWRMCTDYTSLNKVCPKDSYPLPNVDKLVDGASGNELLSLMDAYSGYNQIMMHPSDEESTTFMTNQASYCYKTMPFGLKNAGATYQRLMDKIFSKQVGRNMEVYVDDMIVKSVRASDHGGDLKEVFTQLRTYQMKLNPEKCSFGIQGGKFLGFMLTSRGIEVNPDKGRAILEMKSPTSVKEVQRLTGRMAALSRFLPMAGDKAAPFFTCLKKNSKFQWTEECEQAFTKLKESLATLPVLSKPTPGFPLVLYLAVTDKAVSTVLLQEEGKKQKVIYFVSHTLQGAELRYQKIEKAALAILKTARRLRPYFQSFQVKVKTDVPLRQVLQKPDLSEYDIQYEPRGQVTVQSLIDFVAELTPTEDEKTRGEWVLSVDGSSNKTGSGAGITIESPDKMIIEQSLKFEFKASNNQSEYEALIAGLRLAIELGVQKLFIKGDSQLVVKQVKGEYQVKDPQLSKYLEVVHRLMMEVKEIKIEHVPRGQNERADVLAKLASTGRLGNYQTVIQETLPRPSIDLVEIKLKAVKSVIEGEPSWMESIKIFLENPPKDDDVNTRAKRREASFYTVVDGELYRRGIMSPMLKCVDTKNANGIMAEVHEGVCSSHIGGKSLAVKIVRAGFYWPTMKKDCLEYVKKCEKCQVFSDLHKAPPEELTTMMAPWPFAMWGVDILGPFPVAKAQMKYIIVAVDYFTKWIEAEAVATITAAKVRSFLWRRIVCRFGVPMTLVMDNGTQFTSSVTREFCTEMGIEMRFASVEHPQTNGQAESANKVILKGLKKKLDEAKGLWAEELPGVLWAYNTTEQSSTKETPYRLTYGTDAMLPVEIENQNWRVARFNENDNGENLIANLVMLPEEQREAHIRNEAGKVKVARKFSTKVVPRKMRVGDLVLRKNTIPDKHNKLSPNWGGPYRIIGDVGGGAYKLEQLNGQKVPRTWNASHLKQYFS
ncbi:uncharacterized protein LOC130728374 [Lotus japonicus]|uniref:uncharacterized protein LOC130728374 n=1 Tax=Lotus japonicus TaxID=34305 RepID=UPI00258BA069|nr:uncharacterized protein LOC130728374 [Lotus japonicus]